MASMPLEWYGTIFNPAKAENLEHVSLMLGGLGGHAQQWPLRHDCIEIVPRQFKSFHICRNTNITLF